MRSMPSRLMPTLVLTLSLALGWIAVAADAHAVGDALRRATDIRVLPAKNAGAQVVVEFTAPPTYSARLERQGKRLIIDVPNADLGRAPTAITRRVGVVGGVMAQTFKSASSSKVTRIL